MGSLLIASALAGLAVAAPPHYNTQSRVLNKDATNTLNRQEDRPVLMTSGYLESQARRSIKYAPPPHDDVSEATARRNPRPDAFANSENLDAKDDEKIVVEIADETSGNATSSVVINGTSVHEVPTKVTGEKNIGQVLKDIVDNIKGVMDKLVAGGT